MRQLFEICCSLVLLLSSGQAADVRFVATSRHFNSKFISNLTVLIGKDPNKLDLDVELLRPITKDLFAFVDIQIRLKDSTRYQSLFTESFDVCELVNNVFVDNLMKKWYRNILKYSNFMEYCPVPEGYYFFRGLMVEQTSLAMYLRPGDYRIIGELYFKESGTKNETLLQGMLDVKWEK